MPTWPTNKPDSNRFNSDSDSIKQSRQDLKTMSDAVNDIVDFVDTTGIANNDVLKYNSTSQRLEPGQAGIDNPLLIGNQAETDSAGATLGKIEFIGTDSALNTNLRIGFENANTNAPQINLIADQGINGARVAINIPYASGTNGFYFSSTEAELSSNVGGGVVTNVNRLRVTGPGLSGSLNFQVPSITTFNKDLYIGPLSDVDAIKGGGVAFTSATQMQEPAIFFDESAGSIYISVRNLSDSAGGTGDLFLNYLKWPTTDGSADQFLKTDGSGNLSWSTAAGGGSMNHLIDDTTPQLGGSLDVNGFNITSASGDIAITPGGTGQISLDGQKWPASDGNANETLMTDGAGNLSYTPFIKEITAGTGISINTDSAGIIEINSTASGGDNVAEGDNISISQPDSSGSKTISLRSTLNQPINGGDQQLSDLFFKNYGEFVYTSGSTTGTISPNPHNGVVQKITLTGSITINGLATTTTGDSVTMIIKQPSSGGPYTLSSTMKFAGGSKTLSTGANEIDVLTIFYDGTDYLASLSTNFS